MAAVVTPAAGQLGFAVDDGADLDAFAAGVRQPGRQRDRADLGDLVQAHEQRRVQAAGPGGLAHLRGNIVDLRGHGGEQRSDRSLLRYRFGDHVQGAGLAEKGGNVEPGAGSGQHRRGQGRVRHERQRPRHDQSDRGGGLLRLGAELGQSDRPLVGPAAARIPGAWTSLSGSGQARTSAACCRLHPGTSLYLSAARSRVGVTSIPVRRPRRYPCASTCRNQMRAASPSLRVTSSTVLLWRRPFRSSASWAKRTFSISLLPNRASNRGQSVLEVSTTWSSRRSQYSSLPDE